MSTCSLCGLPVDKAESVSGATERYCCRGCQAIDHHLGQFADESSQEPEARAHEETVPESAHTTYLHVTGMHCTTCETFLVKAARKIQGVYRADASYATETIRVQYDPDIVTRDDLCARLSIAGYEIIPKEHQSGRGGSSDVVRFLIGGGFFGMMTMLWYVLFIYPSYLGFEQLIDLGEMDGRYLFAHIWLFSTIVLGYTGAPILRGAFVSVRAKQPNTNLLIALAASSAYVYSTLALVLGRTDLYFDVTVAIILVVTAGTHYQSIVKQRATGLLTSLTREQPSVVRLVSGERIDVSAIEPDDEFLVKAGERIPLDGVIKEGRSSVDESLVTGESVPVTKTPGESVRGGTIVTTNPITVVAGDPVSSTLDTIVEMLWDVQSSRSGMQRLVDKLATVFVPTVIVLAVIVGGVLLVNGASVTRAILVSLTVLIVTCPCALGLATPLSIARGITDAAVRGIIITSEAIFENGSDIDVVVMDKTGTLTEGDMSVLNVYSGDSRSRTVLQRAAMAEMGSSHPIATAICGSFRPGDGDADQAVEADSLFTDGGRVTVSNHDSVESIDVLAQGVRATTRDSVILVGHPSLFLAEWEFPVAFEDRVTAIRQRGNVPVCVGWDGEVQGVIEVGDRVRDGWEAVVEEIAGNGSEIIVLTGDSYASASRFSGHPAIDTVYAGVPPDAKVETVRRLRRKGTVAMVGDGSNDAPALAAADIGVGIVSGTDLAVDAADVVLLDDRFGELPNVFAIARGTNHRMKQNFGWAFCYNGIAIPLAITGLLNPFLAAVAMVTSSLLVVANSSRSVVNDET